MPASLCLSVQQFGCLRQLVEELLAQLFFSGRVYVVGVHCRYHGFKLGLVHVTVLCGRGSVFNPAEIYAQVVLQAKPGDVMAASFASGVLQEQEAALAPSYAYST
eukprot:TRINITY_DN6548_c0_g1_i2.p5 TRINITY_DN6548_c0_g1~~TRINITY_DN6548_c0_g1_i2.p5  ORF type:complete len:105 (-),score=15.79 TRINITY_DN6548_c0_g1_i2:1078-1392(-)